MLAVGLSYIAFLMLRYVPSIPAFWRVLIMMSLTFLIFKIRRKICPCQAWVAVYLLSAYYVPGTILEVRV